MSDLDTSLAFVTGRIEEEATRSGEALSDEQRYLLKHLPNNSALPIWNGADPEIPPVLIPRNIPFEKLCALARAAHQRDAQRNPALSLDWDFAAAVLKLNRHPMSWLLGWAGLKQRRSRWDRWLLIGAALLIAIYFPASMLVAGNNPWSWLGWTVWGAGYIGISGLLYFVARRIEQRHLNRTIERCRRGSNFQRLA